MTMKLLIAIPSKGRLMDETCALFEAIGHAVERDDARGYRGSLAGLPGVELAFLSASEIAARLADGSVHLGITGEDLMREAVSDMRNVADILVPLGFGHADVVVAVPDAWLDVETMADLAETTADFHRMHGRPIRIATKYRQLTRQFFAARGVGGYRIVDSAGATEGAPAAGTAELIIDITSTGSTLRANGLRVLGDGLILASQANLIAARNAAWCATTQALRETVAGRLAQASMPPSTLKTAPVM